MKFKAFEDGAEAIWKSMKGIRLPMKKGFRICMYSNMLRDGTVMYEEALQECSLRGHVKRNWDEVIYTQNDFTSRDIGRKVCSEALQ